MHIFYFLLKIRYAFYSPIEWLILWIQKVDFTFPSFFNGFPSIYKTRYTTIGCFKSITIGNYVRCGANTVITDSDWHLDDVRSGEPQAVIIEDNVWLGYGVIVLKGVTIGRNTVIGAGSVVTKNIPPNVVAAGNPCVIIKQLTQL